MRIGATELLVVLIVALLLIGPDKLPAYAKKFGEALAVFKKATSDATKDLQESVVEPLNEAQKPLREAVEPLEETRKEVRGQVQDLQRSLNSVGKIKPSEAKRPEKVEDSASSSGKREDSGPDHKNLTEPEDRISGEEGKAETPESDPENGIEENEAAAAAAVEEEEAV